MKNSTKLLKIISISLIIISFISTLFIGSNLNNKENISFKSFYKDKKVTF